MISKKILKNTFMLYSRQVLLIVISLFSVRVVLNTLGVEEFGIYTVVSGVVTLCSFLSGSMASATQRFFSFALGKGDEKLLNTTFSVNLAIYGGIGFLAIVLLESFGFWFVKNHLNVPIDRIDAVLWLYHYSVISFFFSIVSAPFMAIIIAHEDMFLFALVSIVEAFMKLAVVCILLYLPWDKLELYGLLLMGVAIINAIIYLVICLFRYSECQFRKFHWNFLLLKEILSFTVWTLFGAFSNVIRLQAVTILLNQFFNPSVVAARAIAITVASQINLFSNNFNTGMYPAIVKSYASNNRVELLSLIFNGSKLTFFLMWVFTLPLLIEMNGILTFWLGVLPEQTVLFVILALIESLIVVISLPVGTAARAHGKIKIYELTLGSIQLSIFVVCFFVLKTGLPAFSVYVVAISMNVIMFGVRLFIVSRLVELSPKDYAIKVLLPVFLITVTSAIPALGVKLILPEGFYFSILNILFCIIVTTLSMYFIGLDSLWREKARLLVFNKLNDFCVFKR